MKRILIAVLSLAIICIGLNQSAPAVSAQTGVNNFSIQDYQIDYYLNRDKDGRSTLKTVESITALFPEYDQNHGIERAIPNSFDGHPTSLNIESVTDANNRALSYTTYDSNGNTVVRIGDADTYVHGAKSYKLSYSQRDVTRYFGDTGRDEFYWDTNGTDWLVPITNFTARLHLPANLQNARSGETACYIGASGSTERCSLEQNNGTYTASAAALTPYQNVTIAVGFTPKTFSPYAPSLAERLLVVYVLISLIIIPVAIALTVWFLVRYKRRSNRSAELDPIVPEYIPPLDTSVSTAAAISRKPGRSFSAQLIDLAVRHYIRIYETRQKSLFRKANYELEIIKDIQTLKKEEQELLRDIFSETQVGSKLDMASMKNNYSLAKKLQNNPGLLDKSIAGEYGLRAKDKQQSHWFTRAGFITLVAAALTLSPALLIAAIIGFICGAVLKPLTDKGLALARYLKGLELYIGVAETERLQMLQSPEGATKVGGTVDTNDTNDTKQIIKLYERVLPYAVLFGQEKEWNKRLAEYYQTANISPSWYTSNNANFNAAMFSSAMSNFNASATYSSPTSSSSGGSSGGGSSGGGGGGGGGGGW